MTARTGLDDALAAVPTMSIGSAPPYLACTHVHTDDLRRSLRMLTDALIGAGRPTGLRVPDRFTHTELTPPAFDGPGVRYRDAMAELDDVLPAGVDIVVDAGNTGAAAIHTCRCAAAAASRSPWVWAAWVTASAPASAWRSPARVSRPGRSSGGDRRGRRVLHARHGDAHRGAVPACR